MAQVISQTSSPLPFAPHPFDVVVAGGPTSMEHRQSHSFTFPRSDDSNGAGVQHASFQTLGDFAAEPRRNHRRARTSVNVGARLPDFKFGSASTSPTTGAATPPLPAIPSQYAQTPPSMASRHRRVVTELGGSNAPSSMHSGTATFSFPTPPVGNASTSRHRHRRSGAVSSQDLSSIITQKAPHSPKLPTDNQTTSRPTSSGNSENVKKSSSPLTVEFADTVESMPRPTSLVSTGSESSSSTMKELPSHSKEQTCANAPASHLDAPAFAFPGSLPSDFESSLPLYYDLNENFDDDPTMIVTIPEAEMAPQSLSSGQFHVPRPLSSGSASAREPLDSPAEEIDLDCAIADFDSGLSRVPIRSSFQKARSSMHSGSTTGFLGATIPRHRRAESAPSLPPPSFSFPELETSASDRGFPIENVAEEEGEEKDVDKPYSPSALPPVDNTKGSQTRSGVTHSAPSLLPAIQFNICKSSDYTLYESDEEASDDVLPAPRPPFASGDGQYNSTRSSPQFLQSYASSSEASPRCYQSADDVPSLISTSSTVESSFNAIARNSSIPSMNAMIAGSDASVSSSNARQQKRLSIVSLSRLITRSKKPCASAESLPSRQLHTSDGSTPPRHTFGGERLSRMKRLFNPFKRNTTT